MEDRYERLKNYFENHCKVMEENMWSTDAAIGLASDFANVEIMAKHGEILVGLAKEEENIIMMNIIVNSMEDAKKLERWLPNFIRELKNSLELETHISNWANKMDGFYGIRFVFAESSEDMINYKLKIRISTPVLDCVSALELCGNDAEAKRLREIYNLSFVK